MKNLLLSFSFFFLPLVLFSQKLGESDMEEMIKEYKEKTRTASVLNNCGHAFDGTSYWVKEMENKSLDVLFPMAQSDRKKIGKEIYSEILRSNDEVKNHSAKKEIYTIIEKLTGNLNPAEKREFKLTIIDSKEINAYTTMGGYIYLTTGLIDFINSYDELSFILGHEIGHDVLKHTQRKVTKMMVSSQFFNSVNLKDYTNVAINLSTKFSAPFDQIDEYEADKFGVKLAEKASFDPNRFEDFFIKLHRYQDQTVLSKIMSSHPFAEHRRKCIKEYRIR